MEASSRRNSFLSPYHDHQSTVSAHGSADNIVWGDEMLLMAMAAELEPGMATRRRTLSTLDDDGDSLTDSDRKVRCQTLRTFLTREARDVRSILLVIVTFFLLVSLLQSRGSSGVNSLVEDPDFGEDQTLGTGVVSAEIQDEIPIASHGDNQWRLCNRFIPSSDQLQAVYDELINHRNIKPYRKKIHYLDKSMTIYNFGGFSSQLTSLFHAYDKAHDEGATLALQHEGWGHFTLNSFWRVFDNPGSLPTEKYTSSVQNLLDIKYVQNQTQFPPGSEVAIEKPEDYFYYHSMNLTTEEKRDHRRKILRRLFLRSIRKEEKLEDVCSGVDSLIGKTKDGNHDNFRYSVVHIIKPGFAASFLPQLNKALKNKYDNRESIDMRPSYVKHLLSQASSSYTAAMGGDVDRINFFKEKIVLLQDTESPNDEVVSRLEQDSLLKSQIVFPSKDTEWDGSNIMLAVLADVYLGNPVDSLCLWIARMRYALGFNETYVFTIRDDEGQYIRYGEEDLLYDNALRAWAG